MTNSVTQHQVSVAYASWLEMKDGLLMPSHEIDWPEIRSHIENVYGKKGLRRIERAGRRLAYEALA